MLKKQLKWGCFINPEEEGGAMKTQRMGVCRKGKGWK